MRVVLGLGNPGGRYLATRHNAGWQVLDILRGRWGAADSGRDEAWQEWTAERAGRRVHLVKPLLFMNRSGEAFVSWRERQAVEPGQLLVVVDDVYLPLGVLRLRERGSSGGHLGLGSLESALGTREYARLRVGVGAAPAAELREHVLEEFGEEEAETARSAFERAADAVECWITEGATSAMNRFNRRVPEGGC